MKKKGQNQNGTERERKLCDWLCKKVGERKKKRIAKHYEVQCVGVDLI